jgi:prepilin-type N-terminal cleavage/methylation domain-containing protein
MKRRRTRVEGFTLVEIMIVCAIIGLLAAIAIPSWVRARERSQTNTCINNLRQIDGAVQQWAIENKKALDASVVAGDILGDGTAAYPSYLKSSVICPSGGTTFLDSYAVTTVADKPTCVSTGGAAANGHELTVDTSN